MASTPSNRLRLTPSNSPLLPRAGRTPNRLRSGLDTRLSLKRVVGTTCSSPTGFDAVQTSFAYLAGGTVVVVDVDGEQYSQRFYRAHPTAVPFFNVTPPGQADSASPAPSTPKANDSRNRVTALPRDFLHAATDGSESPNSRTWTSRERIKAATCLSLSRDGRFLAVGETGYAPRVLIFSLLDASSDVPIAAMSEHTFGVTAVAWSPDARFLASLGTANDGFIYIWRIDQRTRSAKLFQRSKCISFVKCMLWMGNCLITLGVRHAKAWRVEHSPVNSPIKMRFAGDVSVSPPYQVQKSLPGRNIILGLLLDETFVCAAAVDDTRAIICSEAGDLCLLDDTKKQLQLTKIADLGFPATCIAIQGDIAVIGGRLAQLATLNVKDILAVHPVPSIELTGGSKRFAALGFLRNRLVTVAANCSIDIWDTGKTPGQLLSDETVFSIQGHSEPVLGIQHLPRPNIPDADFYTWSSSGRVQVWTADGTVKTSFDIPLEQLDSGEEGGVVNQLILVRASQDGRLFCAGDKLGILRVINFASKECLMETKAHSSECHDIAIFEDEARLILASCGRDRTVQLFHGPSTGPFVHFQTQEYAAKVVQVLIPSVAKIITCGSDRTIQVHDVILKEGDPEVIAAVSSRVMSLKASPSSLTLDADGKTVFVSLSDRTLNQYDLNSGRLLGSFRCVDESGSEAAMLESLFYATLGSGMDCNFILASSNTDKSIRLYDAQTGSFLAREWGHTEAINGVILLKDQQDDGRKVISVASDGTIMIWALELVSTPFGGMNRDHSTEKGAPITVQRAPLRKVLSKAELAEFSRPSSSSSSMGKRSPPRILRHKSSRFGLSGSVSRPDKQRISPANSRTRLRRGSSEDRSGSPPTMTPKHCLRLSRRPSLPALSSTALTTTPPSAPAHKSSSSSLRGRYGFGSLSLATEQTCRQLRNYRSKLGSSDHIDADVLADLDVELRLTAAALGERAIRSRIVSGDAGQNSSQDSNAGRKFSESVLNSLLDRYSERLAHLLGEKFGLRLSNDEMVALQGLAKEQDTDGERPCIAAGTTLSLTSDESDATLVQ